MIIQNGIYKRPPLSLYSKLGPHSRVRSPFPLLPPTKHTNRSFLQLGAGLSVGFSGLAAGFAIGIVGDAGVRAIAHQPKFFVGMILILIFAGVPGLYGLIVALVLTARGN